MDYLMINVNASSKFVKSTVHSALVTFNRFNNFTCQMTFASMQSTPELNVTPVVYICRSKFVIQLLFHTANYHVTCGFNFVYAQSNKCS